jgi:hypothetical protein
VGASMVGTLGILRMRARGYLRPPGGPHFSGCTSPCNPLYASRRPFDRKSPVGPGAFRGASPVNRSASVLQSCSGLRSVARLLLSSALRRKKAASASAELRAADGMKMLSTSSSRNGYGVGSERDSAGRASGGGTRGIFSSRLCVEREGGGKD